MMLSRDIRTLAKNLKSEATWKKDRFNSVMTTDEYENAILRFVVDNNLVKVKVETEV
jgi:hypothetical protein